MFRGCYVARTDGFDCGIMISASHNPYYDNGIKLINGQGEKMEEEIIALVEDYLDDRLQLFGEKWHKYVYEYMMQNGCRIGGEQSGHIIFSKYASTGDGILTSLKMMEVIMARKKKLSELTADLAIYPQVLENVRVHDKAAAQADVDVQAAVESVAEALGDTGRILVRESGTEPLLRVMVEAESEELCRKYVDQVVEIVRKKGHVAE